MQETLAKFRRWLEEADDGQTRHPAAFALATASADGVPSVRTLLCKGVDEEGFVFYTNLGSDKAADLWENPRASMLFVWNQQRRQVRVSGRVEPVSNFEADAYFATRPRSSRIGAWASRQSEPMTETLALERRIAAATARFGVGPVPRPPFWSGFRLLPAQIEFWEEAPHRLHRRELNVRTESGWTRSALFP